MSDSPRRIAVQLLTHFDVCCSGRHVEIGFTDHSGKPILLYLAHDSLQQLVTLSALLAEPREHPGAQHGNDHALGDWQLDRDAAEGVTRLRLTAADGFPGTC